MSASSSASLFGISSLPSSTSPADREDYYNNKISFKPHRFDWQRSCNIRNIFIGMEAAFKKQDISIFREMAELAEKFEILEETEELLINSLISDYITKIEAKKLEFIGEIWSFFSTRSHQDDFLKLLLKFDRVDFVQSIFDKLAPKERIKKTLTQMEWLVAKFATTTPPLPTLQVFNFVIDYLDITNLEFTPNFHKRLDKSISKLLEVNRLDLVQLIFDKLSPKERVEKILIQMEWLVTDFVTTITPEVFNFIIHQLDVLSNNSDISADFQKRLDKVILKLIEGQGMVFSQNQIDLLIEKLSLSRKKDLNNMVLTAINRLYINEGYWGKDSDTNEQTYTRGGYLGKNLTSYFNFLWSKLENTNVDSKLHAMLANFNKYTHQEALVFLWEKLSSVEMKKELVINSFKKFAQMDADAQVDCKPLITFFWAHYPIEGRANFLLENQKFLKTFVAEKKDADLMLESLTPAERHSIFRQMGLQNEQFLFNRLLEASCISDEERKAIILNFRPDVQIVEKEVKRLQEKSLLFFSFNCLKKVNKIKNAINHALDNGSKNICANNEVIEALDYYRIGFSRNSIPFFSRDDTTARLNVSASRITMR